jgi:type II secretory pathway pseudopilin PulG
MKKSIPELALESAMIVLSVLLALAASSWADSRREHTLVAQARTSFALELRANRARVAKVLPYHQALTAAVVAIDSTGGVATYAAWRKRVPIWSGFAPPDVAATAWQSAIATGALAHMKYPEVSAVSTVYTLQGKFDAFNASYIPLFDFSDPAMAATVRRMHAYMQTVVVYETALIADYDSALVRLDGADRAIR